MHEMIYLSKLFKCMYRVKPTGKVSLRKTWTWIY